MKKIARKIIVNILGWQVRRLRGKNNFKVIGIVGSIGKTSTKFAIATVLGESKKVQFQKGNYNDLVTVPLVFFGLVEPPLLNPFAWIATLIKIESQLRKKYSHEVVVVEIGTNGPGEIKDFARYLDLDLAVVTAITPEHMEYFKTMDAVAKEEFSVSKFTKKLLVNKDLCDDRYVPKDIEPEYYGEKASDYRLVNAKFSMATATFGVKKSGDQWLLATMEAVGKGELYSATAAAAIADMLDVDAQNIVEGIHSIRPVSGRMQRLNGIHDSMILDESYNASPDAVMAALDSLYQIEASQKIAVLGNMNELGDLSRQSHIDIGNYCEPKQLDLVVTIGPDANEFLAPAAQARGCKVKTCKTPYEAGEFVKNQLESKAVVLVKGSQNNVYAEEAVKLLLADPGDAQLLVRQSRAWMAKKRKNFS